MAKFLLSDFNIGFELEAIVKNENKFERPSFSKVKKAIDKHYIIDNPKYVDDDYSINGNGLPFEFKSPIIQVTPSNIMNTLDFLDTVFNNGVYTNNSCGFHIHFSFPYISSMDAIWIISKLSIDNVALNKIKFFNNMNMFHVNQANLDFIYQMRKAINNRDWKSLDGLFSIDKKRLIRIHPQGTLEWRGPRKFLNVYNQDTTKSFFLLLIDFLKWVNNTLESTSINGMYKSKYMEHFQDKKLFDSEQDHK